VTAFWSYLAEGTLPAARDQYDVDVVEAVGDADLGGAWALQQFLTSSNRLHIVDVKPAAGGTSVVAEGIPSSGPKLRWSFFLRPEDGQWKIVYDTFTASALGYFVETEVQRGIDPSPTEPSPEALAAADRAVARYRAAALGAQADEAAPTTP
jgi:hypothetical protein